MLPARLVQGTFAIRLLRQIQPAKRSISEQNFAIALLHPMAQRHRRSRERLLIQVVGKLLDRMRASIILLLIGRQPFGSVSRVLGGAKIRGHGACHFIREKQPRWTMDLI